MGKRVSVDRWLFGVTMLMVFAGLVMVFSASAIVAKEQFGSETAFLRKQVVYALIGLGAMFGFMKLDYRKLNQPALVFTTLGITSLFLVAVFFLDRSHNTHRWIKLGFFSFQPSELAKPAIILFLAHFLESRLRSITDLRHTLLPAIAPTARLLPPDRRATRPGHGHDLRLHHRGHPVHLRNGIEVLRLGDAHCDTADVLPALPHRLAGAPHGRLHQSLCRPAGRRIPHHSIAHRRGHRRSHAGLGLMEGKQKLFYLPEPQTDFIFAVVSEELGLIGAVCFVAAFAFFCFRGLRAAWNTRDNFARLLAVGITAMIGIQAFFNISVVLGLLPTKGIPLPFISYGGSSLIVTLASVGVLLNITQQTD